MATYRLRWHAHSQAIIQYENGSMLTTAGAHMPRPLLQLRKKLIIVWEHNSLTEGKKLVFPSRPPLYPIYFVYIKFLLFTYMSRDYFHQKEKKKRSTFKKHLQIIIAAQRSDWLGIN